MFNFNEKVVISSAPRRIGPALSNKPKMNETKWRQRGGVQKVTFFSIIITRFLVEPQEKLQTRNLDLDLL